MSNIKDIRPEVQSEVTRIDVPEDGNPADFTVDQLTQIVQDGQASVQAHLTEIPKMMIGLTNAASQLGSMRMLLAQKIEEGLQDAD